MSEAIFTIIEAAAKGAKIMGLAYSGGKISLGGWRKPVVVNLAGVTIPEKVPLLANHSNTTSNRVGMVSARIENDGLIIEGEVLSDGPEAENIVSQAKAGGNWQLSIGAAVDEVEFVEEGKTFEANGKTFEGPAYHVTKSTLREVSVVAVGADKDTEMKIAAAFDLGKPIEKEPKEKEMKMENEKEGEVAAKVNTSDIQADAVTAIRAEHKRIAEIEAACGEEKEIAAKAVADGLSVDAAKAMVLDAMRARKGSEINAAFINTGAGAATGSEVIEAAALMSTGAIRSGKLENHYADNVLDAANKMRRISLREMIDLCARMEGKRIEAGCSTSVLAAAGFSTISLPNMLGNIANKALMDAYMTRESAAVKLAEKLSANNFQTHTGIRLGGLGTMEAVQNGGPIKHGTQDEETFTFAVATYAKMIGLTREMLANDDLGGFTRTAASLGQTWFNTRELLFWQLVLANTSNFFHATNSNLINTALSIDGLAEAEYTLAEQTGIDGTPINIRGTYLVVPPQLGALAKQIYTSSNIVSGTDDKVPANNIFAGVYEPVMTPYLSNSKVSDSASETDWYLWSADVKPFGIAYLNGIETPTLEEVDPGAEYLGRAWRCYGDIGVCQVDKRGAVKADVSS